MGYCDTESNNKDIEIKEQYSQIATQTKEENQVSCCGLGGCSTEPYTIFSKDYSQLEGNNPKDDLGLGYKKSTQFATIQKGSNVVDLVSGAINEDLIGCFTLGYCLKGNL
jgi:arsenite methyltransferase